MSNIDFNTMTRAEIEVAMACDTQKVYDDRDKLRADLAKLTAERDRLLKALRSVQEWVDTQDFAIPVRCGVRAALAASEPAHATPD